MELYSQSMKGIGIKWQVGTEHVVDSFVNLSKALGFQVLYKTNEVEEPLQTIGYCNRPDESR